MIYYLSGLFSGLVSWVGHDVGWRKAYMVLVVTVASGNFVSSGRETV